jgi:hypothetical protein
MAGEPDRPGRKPRPRMSTLRNRLHESGYAGWPGRSALSLLAGVAALALAGCGTSAGNTAPLQQAVDAAAKTLALPGVSYNLTMRGSTIFGSLPEPVRGRAAQDLSAAFGYEVLALPETGGRPAQKLYLDFLRVAFLVLPSPPPAGALPDGVSWISVPLKGRSASMDKTLAAQIEGLTPGLALAEVSWGARTASHIGTRVINHLPTEEYRVSIDLARALAAARKSGRATLAAAIEHEQASRRASPAAQRDPSVMLWVNGPGYVARVYSVPAGSGLGATDFSFTDFTVKIPRTIPPPSETVPLSSLTGSEAVPRSLWAVATGSG